MKNRVLVVDDDPAVRQMLEALLREAGHEPMLAGDAASLRALRPTSAPDVVVLDWQLPDGDGIALLPGLKRRWPHIEVIVLTGFATLDAAVEATKQGAFHFQAKPFNPRVLLHLIERAAEHAHLQSQALVLRDAVSTLAGGASPVFRSDAMKAVLRTVERVAPSDASILLTGESGTGKEVVTDFIHALSRRARGPLIKVNCAALPRELIESELFGSVKGAYTGAHADREGLFRQAEGGSLFLDEIAEMPVDTQTKLLRVLQEKAVRPVGGRTSYHTDCRIIAATNRPVEIALREHRLREDLYYRIAAVAVELPPLRDRQEDIVAMAQVFLRRFAAQAGRSVTALAPAALDALLEFPWPGNVRQLENELQRAVLMAEGNVIELRDLSPALRSPPAMKNAVLSPLETAEREQISRVLSETDGNKLAAARRLGIGRQTLYNKLKLYRLGD
jgi:DNA-binding NtrC family response regulator